MGIGVQPTCRYEHGNLIPVAFPGAPRWIMLTNIHSSLSFTGQLFMCPRCGYTEFFDDEPARTAKELEEIAKHEHP